MDYRAARAQLTVMEKTLSATLGNLAKVEGALLDRAETETMRRRPKARQYGRHATTWTGADEAAYQQILRDFVMAAGGELTRLRCRAQRQEAAILAVRRRHGFNDARTSKLEPALKSRVAAVADALSGAAIANLRQSAGSAE